MKQVLFTFTCAIALVISACESLEADTCAPRGQAIDASLVKVIDGDTVHVRLAGSPSKVTKVRLLGINTPEMWSQNSKTAQPLSREATQSLNKLLSTQRAIRLIPGRDSHDRHGRMLAHLFTPNGTNAASVLLSKGLGFHIPIAPNTDYLECYQAAETRSRTKGIGVWAEDFYHPQLAATPKQQGFTLIRGKVSKINASKDSFWIELNQSVSLQLGKKQAPTQSLHQLKDLLAGKEIIARGWLVKRKLSTQQKKKRFTAWKMDIRHWQAINISG